jgi:hypothetical protein
MTQKSKKAKGLVKKLGGPLLAAGIFLTSAGLADRTGMSSAAAELHHAYYESFEKAGYIVPVKPTKSFLKGYYDVFAGFDGLALAGLIMLYRKRKDY